MDTEFEQSELVMNREAHAAGQWGCKELQIMETELISSWAPQQPATTNSTLIISISRVLALKIYCYDAWLVKVFRGAVF